MADRFLKETIRSSKSVNSLSDFDFRVWAYLITYVDDFGRGSADPELLRGFVFPRRKEVTEEQIGKSLDSLARKGMIKLYEADGDSYFYFPKWNKHQQPKSAKTQFPEPSAETRGEPTPSNAIDSSPKNKTDNLSLSIKEYVEKINPNAETDEISMLQSFEAVMGSFVIHRVVDLACKKGVKDPALVLEMFRKAQKAGVTNQFELEMFLQKKKGEQNGAV